VELTLPDVPGFKLEIPAGSVTFPDGSREGYISATVVNSSKIPMTPPNGMQPQFIVTIQPTNALFDPPARLTIPNVDGHTPGAQVEMFSFDHELEEFVAIGLGTVSEDGTVIRSNPGVGVIRAGWHCGAQPGGSGTPNNCDECHECDGTNCVLVPERDKPTDQQSDSDCKNLKCGGAFDPADETSALKEEDECKKCDGGNQVPDPTAKLDDDKQDPHDCKILYCDEKNNEDAPSETLPDDQQVEGDCWVNICDQEKKKRVDQSDIGEDPTPHDCKVPFCKVDGGKDYVWGEDPDEDTTPDDDCRVPACIYETKSKGWRLAPDEKPEDEIVDACKLKKYECKKPAGDVGGFNIYQTFEVEKRNGEPLEGDTVCKYCDDGELKNKVDENASVETSISRPLPSQISSAVNALAGAFGISANLQASYSLKGTVKDCCSQSTGLIEDGFTSASAGVKVSPQDLDVKIWPLGIPRFETKVQRNVFGQYVEILVEVDVGIFVVGQLGFDGQITTSFDQCKGDPECYDASLGVSGSLGLSPKVSGVFCAILDGYVDLQECAVVDIGAEGSGGFQGVATYSCDKGFGGEICSKGITAKAYLKLEVKHDGTTFSKNVDLPLPYGPYLKTCK